MTRPLRVGDSVTIKGEVQGVSGRGYVFVYPEGLSAPSNDAAICVTAESATLVTPAEPPVGSVVVKDGVAWVSTGLGWWYPSNDFSREADTRWDDISDGDIIFTAGDKP